MINEESKLLVLLENTEYEIDTRHNGSLLDYFNQNKIPIHQSCGGNATCGTCQIKVISGNLLLSPRTELEIEMANERGFKPYERLACQTFLKNTKTV